LRSRALSIERCYAILGVRPGTSAEELKRAYYELVREWHPDRLQHDQQRAGAAEERLKEINIAYERLRTHRVEAPNGSAHPNGRSHAQQPGYRSTRNGHDGPTPEEIEAERRRNYERAARTYRDGVEHFESGRLREAVSSLLQSVCLRPDAEAYLLLGISYRQLKMPAKAASALKHVVRLRPDHEQAHYGLGQSLIAMGEYKEAVRTSAQLLRHRPDSAPVSATLGMAYRRLNRLPQAMEALQTAVRLQPGMAEAHYELGEAYIMMSDLVAARAQYDILRPLDADLAVKLLLLIIGQ
jgi:tetratricopeptide (TPR) repeat protein